MASERIIYKQTNKNPVSFARLANTQSMNVSIFELRKYLTWETNDLISLMFC